MSFLHVGGVAGGCTSAVCTGRSIAEYTYREEYSGVYLPGRYNLLGAVMASSLGAVMASSLGAVMAFSWS